MMEMTSKDQSESSAGLGSLFDGLSVAPQPFDSALMALSLPSAPTHMPLTAHPAINPAFAPAPVVPAAPSAPTMPSMQTMQSVQSVQLHPLSAEENTTTGAAVSSSSSKKKGSLSSLYQPAQAAPKAAQTPPPSVLSSQVVYPELPRISRGGAVPQRETARETARETDALLGDAPSSSQAQAQVVSGASDTLVNELLQENSRLSDEVTRLQLLLSQRQQQSETPLVPPPNVISSQDTSQTQVRGVETSGNEPPREGVKYVCCGRCQQWLIAPRSAVYVVCSRCEVVNNCNIPSPSNTSQASQNTTLINRNDQIPWFLDCFRQWF